MMRLTWRDGLATLLVATAALLWPLATIRHATTGAERRSSDATR